MSFDHLRNIYKAELSQEQFDRLGSFINKNTGIKMPSTKRVMVQARLKKRLRALDMVSFEEYLKYVFGKEGFQTEIVHIFDAVSTNKTDFYREPAHFDFLKKHVLPQFEKESNGKLFKIWSAACSSGEEAYTMAITIQEYLGASKKFDYIVSGSDISTRILQMAVDGIFPYNKVVPAVPDTVMRRYFMRSRDPKNRTLRVIPELRQKTSFFRLNFMDDDYKLKDKFDAVFCRNVLIYFDRDIQEAVIRKLCRHIKSGGYLFHGHSESLYGMDLPLKLIKPTIYKRV
ncbi:protein-glutamate O-methyltransferase CheR [Marinilabiliaceae bacterium ANBcel2]|nr:protein-glutamate O-methyltransferase CheR [Marinilabiliaceae bacterium ANBcel2]